MVAEAAADVAAEEADNMDQIEALEVIMGEARLYGSLAVDVVMNTFLTAYQTHKEIHGSFKHLIMDDYVRSMDERVHYQLDQARDALKHLDLIVDEGSSVEVRVERKSVPPSDSKKEYEMEVANNGMRI